MSRRPMFPSASTAPRSSAEANSRRQRVARATGLVGVVLVLGSLGFYVLDRGRTSLLDCIYMTVITVTTVGYEEVIPRAGSVPLTVFTILVILVGVGAVLYLLTALAAMVVEGDIHQRLWRRRMEKRIQSLRDHVIVVGVGRCGSQVVRELYHAGAPFVAVDLDASRLELLAQELRLDFPFISGDGIEDTVLRAAGVERARAAVAALPDDRDNLFLCLTARQIHPGIRLAAKVDERTSFEKFEKVGVNAVVSPPVMGGRHLAGAVLRPELASFVDGLLRVTESSPALSEVHVEAGAEVAGKSLGEANLRTLTNCLILGIREDSDSFFMYNPGPEVGLTPGSSVIALGDPVALERLRALMHARG